MTQSLKAKTPGYIIEHTAKRLKRAFQQTLVAIDADITVDQWVLLDLISRKPGMSQIEISEATAKDRPTVTRILDRLEDKRLVARRGNDEDRRKFGIYPTAAGTNKVNKILPVVEQFRLNHFDGLNDTDLKDFLRIMDKINKNISATQNQDHALL